MWGDRSGREPARARSPLRLRRAFGLMGTALCVVALAVLGFTGWGSSWAVWILVALVVIGPADATVITRHVSREDRNSP